MEKWESQLARETEGPRQIEGLLELVVNSQYNLSALLCDFLQQYFTCLVTGIVMRIIIDSIQCCSKEFAR